MSVSSGTGPVAGLWLDIPEDWRARQEEGVWEYHPPRLGGGCLRLVARHVPISASPEMTSAYRHLGQVAWHFLRPDDPQVEDRAIDPWPDGGLFAHCTATTTEEAGHLRHYLWLRGRATVPDGPLVLALAAFSFFREYDGRDPWAATVTQLDSAMRTARWAEVTHA